MRMISACASNNACNDWRSLIPALFTRPAFKTNKIWTQSISGSFFLLYITNYTTKKSLWRIIQDMICLCQLPAKWMQVFEMHLFGRDERLTTFWLDAVQLASREHLCRIQMVAYFRPHQHDSLLHCHLFDSCRLWMDSSLLQSHWKQMERSRDAAREKWPNRSWWRWRARRGRRTATLACPCLSTAHKVNACTYYRWLIWVNTFIIACTVDFQSRENLFDQAFMRVW